jgi:hypothetical protein
MMPTTPNGCGSTCARAGQNHLPTPARRGRIQLRPLRNAPFTSSRLGQSSASSVSIAGLPPKSASIASAIADS